MKILVYPGSDVRSKDIKLAESVTVIIDYNKHEFKKAHETRDSFANLDIWFESDYDEHNNAIIVLWQGDHNDKEEKKDD